MKPTIADEIRKGIRLNGAELRPEDLRRFLDTGFGQVLPIDIGKRVWLRDYGLTMENNEQRDARKKREDEHQG